ncbi:MAG: glycosyltransferase [Gammaproteobacteria bacterium]
MNKAAIAVVLPNLGIGGAETQLITIANALGDQFHFHFILFSGHQPLASRLKGAEIHCFSNPIRGVIGLPRLLRRLNCRIVLSSIIDVNILVLAIRPLFPSGTRIIVREALDPLSAIRLTRFPGLYRWLYRKFYRTSDYIICLSERMSEAVRNLIGQDTKARIKVISNGVDQARILPVQSRFNPHRIIAIGRLDHQKGYDLLIQGFNRYLSESGDREAHLTIYGEGTARCDLERMIDSLGLTDRVLMPGTDPAVIRKMQSCAFLVISSRFEGMSNVMLEALANGVPVLATSDKTGAAEVIDSSNGILIRNAEDQQIAVGIGRMFTASKNFDRQKIAENASKTFCIPPIATRYTDLFASLAG